jgi:hypothetical protein
MDSFVETDYWDASGRDRIAFSVPIVGSFISGMFHPETTNDVPDLRADEFAVRTRVSPGMSSM